MAVSAQKPATYPNKSFRLVGESCCARRLLRREVHAECLWLSGQWESAVATVRFAASRAGCENTADWTGTCDELSGGPRDDTGLG